MDDDLNLRETGGEVSVEWKIQNFLSLPKEIGYVLYSPNFRLSDAIWYLSICPNGERGSEGCVGVYLYRHSSTSPKHTVAYTIGILKRDGSVYVEENEVREYREDEGYGFSKFIVTSKMLNEKNIFSEEGSLRVYCTVRDTTTAIARKNTVGNASQTVAQDSVEILQQNLKVLILTGEHGDVTFQVEGQALPAHRSILSVRSPVFSSMFKHDTQEKKTGIINIIDFHADTFRDFLFFIYTSKTDMVSSANSVELYKIADRYDLNELKGACVTCMADEISLESFSDVVLLATMHNESELLETATDFFIENVKTILPTSEWQALVSKNFTVTNELLIKMANKKL